MTTSRIIFQNESGGVSVIIPTGELPIEEVAAKDVPEGVAYEIVEDDAIPSDRFFRNAWVANGAAVDVDHGGRRRDRALGAVDAHGADTSGRADRSRVCRRPMGSTQ